MTRSGFVMFLARPDMEDSYIVYNLSHIRVNPLTIDICVWGASGSIVIGYKTTTHNEICDNPQ